LKQKKKDVRGGEKWGENEKRTDAFPTCGFYKESQKRKKLLRVRTELEGWVRDAPSIKRERGKSLKWRLREKVDKKQKGTTIRNRGVVGAGSTN